MTSVDSSGNSNAYLYFLILSGTGMCILMIRVLGGVLYLFAECCKKKIKLSESVAIKQPRKFMRPGTINRARTSTSALMKKLSMDIENTGSKTVNSKRVASKEGSEVSERAENGGDNANNRNRSNEELDPISVSLGSVN